MDNWITDAFYKKRNEFSNSDFHSHTEFEIYRFHEGDCRYIIGNKIYYLQPGDIVVMNGLTLHRAFPSAESPYVRSVVSFSSEWIKPSLCKDLNLPELLEPFTKMDHVLLRMGDHEWLKTIDFLMIDIEKTKQNCDRIGHANCGSLTYRMHEGKFKMSLIQLLMIIYDLSQSYFLSDCDDCSEKEHRAFQIKKWIDQNYAKPLSLESIAVSLAISRSYMAALFKEVTDLSVMEYVMHCRLNAARYMLEMENKTIFDISVNVGFESVSHFSRYFKKKLGKTPTEYRKLIPKKLGQI
ncbi:AraC family transcriptional regulator [Heyndrickxia acidicola]|uniref:AraC family transcriptional regulator n=1 Tax=Heyndrickxia acidicola TaxID=209389 RepID=A0ABU6MGP4_9BACI|nr:AraC family transcriptional regulator [Heyndrickxia acidicola]MED1203583.1 AraC family transcriptional regulator [Heyndrickxia acidicola]